MSRTWVTSVTLFAAALVGLAAAPRASAAITPPAFTLSDTSGDSVTIDSTGTATCTGACTTTVAVSVGPGSVSWSGTVGPFTIVGLQGRSKPALPSSELDVDIAYIATAAQGGTLTLSFTDTGFTGVNASATLNETSSVFAGSGTLTYTAYVDNTNALFGTGTEVGTFSNTGGNNQLSGPGPAKEPYSMTVVQNFAFGPNTSGNDDFSLMIPPTPLTLACTTASGQVGVPYSSGLVANGGVPPYTFTITSGSLPPGLLLDMTTGSITGTPTMSGTFNFTAQALDSAGFTADAQTVNCSITVTPMTPQLTLSCSGSTGQVGVPYNSSLVAMGGVSPYTFSISLGTLPPGLFLNANTGAITGTPTTYGTYNFTAKVVDHSGNSASNTVSVQCSITIAAPKLTLLCAASAGQVGVPYSSALVAGGGVAPYKFAIVAGSLPPGLTLTAATGAITGTPLAYGTFMFSAQVTDSSGNTSTGVITTQCSIAIAPLPISVHCAASSGQVALPYTSAIVVSGGVAPYTFAITSGSLPAGLTLNTSTGAITGTPSSEGTFNFSVTVADSSGNSVTGVITTACSISITTCGTKLPPVTCNVNENKTNGQIAWFNSHLTKLGGVIPNSTFSIYVSGGKITFGPNTLSVPDAIVTFSSTAKCSSTSFNTAFNRWETTVPLSYASQADEVFAAGLAYLIPGNFPQNVNNMTWSANVSASVTGLQVTWQYGISHWLQSKNGTTFPGCSGTSFTPSYSAMNINPVHNAPACNTSYSSGDHAGAPECAGRSNVLTGGGSGGGGSNWTGAWCSTPGATQVRQPTGPAGPGR